MAKVAEMIEGAPIFSAAPKGAISDEDVQRFAPTLIRMEEQLGHRLKPVEVVEVARNPRSPLHAFFDWDDESAAQKYRLWKARKLIGSVRILVIDEKGRKVPQRAFFNVRLDDDEEPGRAYVSIGRVMEDAALRKQVVERALMDAEHWAEKYRQVRELKRIRIVIRRVAKTLRRRKR